MLTPILCFMSWEYLRIHHANFRMDVNQKEEIKRKEADFFGRCSVHCDCTKIKMGENDGKDFVSSQSQGTIALIKLMQGDYESVYQREKKYKGKKQTGRRRRMKELSCDAKILRKMER